MKIREFAFFILLVCIGLMFFFKFNQNYENTFTNLSSEIDIQSTRNKEKVLLKGDILSGDFMSPYANLGQVAVRFFNFNRDSDDILEFRIKESESDEWFYRADYKTDQFLPNKIFRFGFPIIPDSGDKKYRVEIESLKGSTVSGIALSKNEPQALAIYNYNRAYLSSGFGNFRYFAINKIKNIFENRVLRYSLFLYLLPAFFYLLILLSGRFYILPAIFSIGFLVTQINNPDHYHSFQYLLVPLMWIATSIYFGFSYKIVAYFSSFLLGLGSLSLLRADPITAEIFLSWGYVFMFTVLTYILILDKFGLPQTISPKQFVIGCRNQLLEILSKYKFLFINIIGKERVTKTSAVKIISLSAISIIVAILTYRSATKLFVLYEVYEKYYQSESLINFLKFNTLRLSILYSLSLYVGFRIYRFFGHFLPAVWITFLLISIFQPRIVGMDKNILVNPRILSISPDTIHESWTDVVITGYNFKDLPFVGKVVLGGVDQYLLVDWTDKRIIFRTNPDTTKTGNLIVVTDDGKISNTVKLNYTFDY